MKTTPELDRDDPNIARPNRNVGELSLADIINVSAIQSMMDDFYALTEIGVAIVDLEDNVLIATGWQDICTQYHRVHPVTCQHCLESDLILSDNIELGTYRMYKCRNHMWDIATPIIIGGKKMGNLFLGQFFFDDEVADRELFRAQAQAYGFDEEAYLTALDRVPRWSRKKVDAVMRFYANFARQIATLSYSNLELARALSERDQAELERERLLVGIQEQARQMQAILDTVPEGVLLLGADGRVLMTNPVAERDLTALARRDGDALVTHLGDMPIAEILRSSPNSPWYEVTAGPRTFEIIARSVKDSLRTEGQVEAYVLVVNDVSLERQFQMELRRHERLAAVGQLAAGIAHDFNNILAVIVLYAQMALQSHNLPQWLRSDIRVITQEAHHASDLVQQILDFGRRAVLEPRPMDLVPFLTEQVGLLERTLPEDIRIALHLDSSHAMVNADPTRMQQMVTNLAVNARDAMQEGGTLTIGVTFVKVEPGTPPPVRDMAPGTWIELTFADTGTGIPPDVLQHIFEPFYTTKEPGKGSGLGLAQVYGIVKQHDGAISVDTATGRGTTFSVYLPALAEATPSQPSTRSEYLQRGHGEIVLVVEDNAMLRQALVNTLGALNYRAREATDGREALAILTRRAGRDEGNTDDIAVVLSDMIMPDMGGQALFEALKEEGILVPVVLMSGHPMKQAWQALQTQGLAGWLQKPPELNELADVLARALQGDDVA